MSALQVRSLLLHTFCHPRAFKLDVRWFTCGPVRMLSGSSEYRVNNHAIVLNWQGYVVRRCVYECYEGFVPKSRGRDGCFN